MDSFAGINGRDTKNGDNGRDTRIALGPYPNYGWKKEMIQRGPRNNKLQIPTRFG
jgi:hypothetical protein